MALDDGGGDIAELAAVVLGVVAQQLEGRSALIEWRAIRMPFACSISARRPNAPCRLWYSAEALERDVDRALQLVRCAVDDVGEDTALRGLVDVRRVVGVEDRDHGAGRLADDLGDQLQRVLGARPEPDQRDVGVLPGGDRARPP